MDQRDELGECGDSPYESHFSRDNESAKVDSSQSFEGHSDPDQNEEEDPELDQYSDELEHELEQHIEHESRGESLDVPITFESEDEGSSSDDDDEIEVLGFENVAAVRRHPELVYDEDMDDEEVEEIMSETQPKNLQVRKGFISFNCPVCMDFPEKTMVTPCGHMYCTDCGLRALSSTAKATERKGECSICRKKIDYKQITYLEMRKGTQ